MNSSETFCLRWNDFEDNILGAWRGLRQEQEYCDVTLACDDGLSIEAHRLILSAGSKFFCEIFKKAKHPNPFIYLKGIQKVELEYIIDFLYNGEASIAQEDLNKFLETGRDLQVKGLQNIGENGEEISQRTIIDDIKVEVNELDSSTMDSPENLEYSENAVDKFKTSDKGSIQMDDDNIIRLNTQLEQMIERKEGVWHCKFCTRTSTLKMNLKRHAETHIGGVEHICDSCNKTFSTREALRKHKTRNHKDITTKVLVI